MGSTFTFSMNMSKNLGGDSQEGGTDADLLSGEFES